MKITSEAFCENRHDVGMFGRRMREALIQGLNQVENRVDKDTRVRLKDPSHSSLKESVKGRETVSKKKNRSLNLDSLCPSFPFRASFGDEEKSDRPSS